MCKVMILKGIENNSIALTFMKGVANTMSIGNSDGIGYSAINSKNKLFSEKWHNNRQFLDTETVIDSTTLQQLEPFKKRLPSVALNYASHGKVTRDDIRTVTMHTRFATCGREFQNTHPFITNDISLIHNGVISNAGELNLNKVSTCDSENALQLYNNLALNHTTQNADLQSFVNKLKGYWAFGILAKDADGIYHLDVVRERAQLHWTELPELGENCMVFATTKEIIEDGIKSVGLDKREIYVLPEYLYTRFNALTGDFVFEEQLEESMLNRYIAPVKTYSPHSHYSYNNKTNQYERTFNFIDDDIYEGFSFNKPTTTTPADELTIESFYDTEEPLLDRLYNYDALMGTQYGTNFEDIPVKIRMFIERKEEEEYLIFDDILIMIEEFIETQNINSIYKVYKEKKRA